MERIISLSQARRRWRRILRLVELDWTIVITRHGKPVCTISRALGPGTTPSAPTGRSS
ncbi:type II toxin-antitoxin system Phd/YefM family antitoxin [Priestia aryabhattai]|nr:type II toxin-antitoxin system Phd/YefM family antitoxin [Priestia aryabhattai]